MSRPLRVLIVEDSEDDMLLLVRELRRGGYDPTYERVDTPSAMNDSLEKQEWDIVISDYSMPHFSAPSALELLKKKGLDLPFIMVSGAIGEETAVAAMKAGANDYIMKHELARLNPAIDRGLREAEMGHQRRRAEERLRESEERYRTLLEAIPDPVVVYDMKGTPVYFSPAFTNVFGWSLEEPWSKKTDYIPEENLPETQTMIDKVLAGEGFSCIESRRYTKEDKIVDVSISGAIYLNREGNPAGSIHILRDITEKRRLEAQFQQTQKMEAIGTLAGGIAHDFNNILGIILGNTELVLDDIPESSPATEDLEEVRKACLRAKDLVKQILTFTRQREQERRAVKVSPIVKEVLKSLRAFLPSTIEIRQNIEVYKETILADPTQIHQVLMNLCTNAAHAMGSNGGILEVCLDEVELDPEVDGSDPRLTPGRYVRLKVIDTGSGIDPVVMDRIFDPYFTTKGLGEGTGMGLAVVHGIVKGLDGVITVDSELEKGTTFQTYFPRVEREAAVESETPARITRGEESILFVDDEEAMVNMGKKMLERLGYKVVTRTNPLEALETFEASPDKFDLVITDQTMPNMTGEILAKELMAIRPDIPVILCTGFSEAISEDRAGEVGIRRYIMKPISTRQIAETIREALD